MKNRGLRNRFNREDIATVWVFDYFDCMWCGENHADCFHHVISPSSMRYQDGDFNSSILNACPLSNFKCHLFNGDLHKIENEKILLRKVVRKVLKSSYKLKEKDNEFMRVYWKMYIDEK